MVAKVTLAMFNWLIVVTFLALNNVGNIIRSVQALLCNAHKYIEMNLPARKGEYSVCYTPFKIVHA